MGAAGPAFGNAKREKSMKRKNLVLGGIIILILAAGIAILFWPAESGPRHDLVLMAEAERELSDREYARAEKLFEEVAQITSDQEVVEKARRLGRRAKGYISVGEIRRLIYDEERFGEALPALQEAVRLYGSDRDLSAEFARLRITAVVADYVVRSGAKYSQQVVSVDEDELREARNELNTVVERYRENKENGYLEGLGTLEKIRERLVESHKNVSKRLSSLLTAKDDWEDVLELRKAESWRDEVGALQSMLKHPNDIVLSLTKGSEPEAMIENAKHFANGIDSYAGEKYDEASEYFKRVREKDFHYDLARRYIQEIASNAEYYKGLRLYKDGKPGDAAAMLVRIRLDDSKFSALYDLAVDRQEQVEGMARMQQDKEWHDLKEKAQGFKSTLERPRDNFYVQLADKNLELSRQKIAELERQALWTERKASLDELEKAFIQRNYSTVIAKGRELLAMVQFERFADLVQEANALLLKTEEIVLAEAKAWLPEGTKQWEQYLANPMDEVDRRGELTDSIRRKIDLLSGLYRNSSNALMGARQLSPEKVAEVEQINRMVTAEVLYQQEVLFNIRDTYERLGNMAHLKASETKIILLPNVEGSNWHRRIRSQNAGAINVSFDSASSGKE